MLGRVVSTLVAALLLCRGALAADDEAATTAADVQADRLEVRHAERKALFEGHVRALYNGLELRCDRLEVSYGEDGALVALLAEGKVAVIRGEARARASRARLDARQGLLVLEGEPVLVQGGSELSGSRIAVHLASGRLEIKDARGTFALGGSAP